MLLTDIFTLFVTYGLNGETSSLCGTSQTHNIPNITEFSKEKDLSDLLVLHSD